MVVEEGCRFSVNFDYCSEYMAAGAAVQSVLPT